MRLPSDLVSSECNAGTWFDIEDDVVRLFAEAEGGGIETKTTTAIVTKYRTIRNLEFI